jgi:hypothetical protein
LRRLARTLRQSQSKDLRLLRQIYAMNFWDTTLAADDYLNKLAEELSLLYPLAQDSDGPGTNCLLPISSQSWPPPRPG